MRIIFPENVAPLAKPEWYNAYMYFAFEPLDFLKANSTDANTSVYARSKALSNNLLLSSTVQSIILDVQT
jgi:hypothetical protein